MPLVWLFTKSAGEIRDHSIGVCLAKDTLPQSNLLFPGKICTDREGDRLAISDTGHHRVIVMNRAGVICNTVGGGPNCTAGFVDGSFQEARFHSPQGVAFKDELIFVADTENHSIRKASKF